MPLELTVETLDGLDDSVKSLYKQTDEGYALDVNMTGEVERLRSHVERVIGEKHSIQEKYRDVDLEQWNQFKTQTIQAQESKAKEENDIESLVELRTKEMKTSFETTFQEKDQKISAMEQQLRVLTIDQELTRAASQSGVKSNALDDVLLHGRSLFSLDDGKVVAKDENGNVKYNSKSEPYSISEFVQDLVKNKPYLLEESVGGGASNKLGGNGPALKKISRSSPEYSTLFAKYNKEIIKGTVKIVD